MTTQSIYNRFTQAVIFSCEAATLREAVEKAVAEGVSLSGANLEGANLSGADLYGADLYRAYPVSYTHLTLPTNREV